MFLWRVFKFQHGISASRVDSFANCLRWLNDAGCKSREISYSFFFNGITHTHTHATHSRLALLDACPVRSSYSSHSHSHSHYVLCLSLRLCQCLFGHHNERERESSLACCGFHISMSMQICESLQDSLDPLALVHFMWRQLTLMWHCSHSCSCCWRTCPSVGQIPSNTVGRQFNAAIGKSRRVVPFWLIHPIVSWQRIIVGLSLGRHMTPLSWQASPLSWPLEPINLRDPRHLDIY